MKTLKRWKIVFLVMTLIGIVLLILSKTSTGGTSDTMRMLRPIYLIISLIFFVAAVIMDIIKAALIEEQQKQAQEHKQDHEQEELTQTQENA